MEEYDSKHYFQTGFKKTVKKGKKGHLCVNQKEWCVEPYALDKY